MLCGYFVYEYDEFLVSLTSYKLSFCIASFPFVDQFNAATIFNSDISSWDTSSLEDTQWMFYEAVRNSLLSSIFPSSLVYLFFDTSCSVLKSSFNIDLSKWDVSSVDNMVSEISVLCVASYTCHMK